MVRKSLIHEGSSKSACIRRLNTTDRSVICSSVAVRAPASARCKALF